MEKSRISLREHAMETINYKKNMKSLTNEQLKSCQNVASI